FGQLGYANALTWTPALVRGLPTATGVRAGPDAANTCAVAPGGAAYCWGDNAYGQLGTGTLTNNATPVAVTAGIGFDALATYGVHTCGLSSGTAYCWGDNASGELGDGSTASRSQPSAVSGDRKSTRLNSSHQIISYAVFCLKKKNTTSTIS